MRDYFYTKFPWQLGKVKLQKPNEIVREMLEDENIVFFGGPEWEGISDDLSTVPRIDRSHFILSLLMVVLTDQCIYTYYKESYPTWRRRTNYPKFGWSGFGPHHENPFKVLWAAEREMIIEPELVINLLPEFVTFYLDETKRFFVETLPHIDYISFVNSIKQDPAFAFDQGQIVQSFKTEFIKQTGMR